MTFSINTEGLTKSDLENKSDLEDHIKYDQESETYREETRLKSSKIDHMFKSISNVQRSRGNSMKTTFVFSGDFHHGLKLQGEKPSVIYPFGEIKICYNNINISTYHIQNKLRYVLEYIVNVGALIEEGLCIIGFDQITCSLFQQVLLWMNKSVCIYTPTMQYNNNRSIIEMYAKKSSDQILITDHIGSHGSAFKMLLSH